MTRRVLCAAVALGGLNAIAQPARAFKVVHHQQITTGVLTELGFDAASVSVVNASNAKTDTGKESLVDEAHFDNESLAQGSRRLRDLRDGIVAALANRDRKTALDDLGRALHTAQDFFSHSNFVESNGDDAAVDLLTLQDPAQDLPCDQKTHKGGLTTGYYPIDHCPPLKCTHQDLNKDTPNRKGFDRAVAMAARESRHYVEAVLESIRLQTWPNEGQGQAMVQFLKSAQ
ncbi:MAG: hypothetical protein NTY77_14285 [Elusimicrobia bacterium]|nr:hypothetical protein [Elusimicrobiota bacterium]